MSEAANARRAKKYKNIAKAAWVNNEPAFNPIDYTASLIRNLNFYNFEVESKEKMEWTLQYWKQQGKKHITELRTVSPGYFSQTGAIVRLIERGVALEDRHVSFLENKYSELLELAKKEIAEKEALEKDKPVQAKKMSVQDHLRAQAKSLANDIDEMLDVVVTTGKAPEDIARWIKGRHLPAAIVKNLHNYFKFGAESVQDPEPYNPKTYRALKKFYTELMEALAVVKASRVQKPRVKKQKPAGELIKNFKFTKEAEGLTGESAVKIVGAKEVYLFNTERRKLTQIVAMDGLLLSVKGTTIVNMDAEKSFSKTVRKPEILKDMAKLGLRAIRNLFKEIKAVARPANGRSNEKTIIMAVF